MEQAQAVGTSRGCTLEAAPQRFVGAGPHAGCLSKRAQLTPEAITIAKFANGR